MLPTSLNDLLATGAADAPAISAPGRTALDFRALRALIGDTLASLNAWGIGRNDRVAIVLNNGPEMAACFAACACGVTSAPLNPGYRGEEFEFYLADLSAKALIVEQGSSSPAIAVAEKLGLRVLDLVAGADQGAGSFVLQARDQRDAMPTKVGGFSQPDDI